MSSQPLQPARRGGRGRRGNRGGAQGNSPSPQAIVDAELTASPRSEASENRHGSNLRERPPGSEDAEADVCFICASPTLHNAVAPCNHRTCHICALRLRALYKTKACAHCRTEAQYVIFTDSSSKRYEEFREADFSSRDDNLGIKYEKPEIYEDTVLLLRYNCPDSNCDVACLGWPDLHRHVSSVHQKAMCNLCTRNKKVFTHEHELFMPGELKKHERVGDDNPGAIDQSGFTGHPECGFCRQRFYGSDELYTHCRDKHERCHICDRRSQGGQPQYFVNYQSLEAHFGKEHFICLEQECLEKKFIVFDSEIDLKAHQLEIHPNGLSKDARRDARRIDMSGFDYRSPHQPDRRGGREGRGRGRGRDLNAEPIPISTAQPLRRDELAFQRQLAVQSAQSVSTRTFGDQLTTSNVQTDPNLTVHQPNFASNLIPAVGSQSASRQPQTPQEQARALRHTSVTERASRLLGNETVKLEQFRAEVSSYKTGTLSASGLVDSFFSLFDAPANELGSLIKELASLFEDEAKNSNLLKAWRDWRAINDDYPSLPGPNGTAPMSSSGGGTRILKIKNSTTRSNNSWRPSGTSSTNTFPALPIRTSARAANSGLSTASNTADSRPSSNPPSSRVNVKSPIPAADAFPALPSIAKPSTAFGYGLAPVRNGTPIWGSTPGSETVSEAETELPAASGKRRGNKGKKQTLYHFG